MTIMRRANQTVSLGDLLESFFNKRLVEQQNVSQNTVDSYRDTWRLFLRFLTEQKKLPLQKLTLDTVTAESVLDFFMHLETERKCSINTRNQRRAAIRAFAKHGIIHEPRYLAEFHRILSIPSKNYHKKVLGFLTKDEMDAVLSAPNIYTQQGRRDYLLLTLMYNTGARVSEITSICCHDIKGTQILIHGKLNKDRVMPLWSETAKLISNFIAEEELDQEQSLFLNTNHGEPLTRSGVAYILASAVADAVKYCSSLRGKKVTPHTIRHTTAMHLLQSGTDINTIRMWLGHVNLDTTHGYIEADLEMKRNALEKGGIIKPELYSWKPTDDVKAYLDTLGVR